MRDMVVPRGCKVVYDEHAYYHLRESFKATCKYLFLEFFKLRLTNYMM